MFCNYTSWLCLFLLKFPSISNVFHAISPHITVEGGNQFLVHLIHSFNLLRDRAVSMQLSLPVAKFFRLNLYFLSFGQDSVYCLEIAPPVSSENLSEYLQVKSYVLEFTILVDSISSDC